MSREHVRRHRNKLVADGFITEEEIENAQEERKAFKERERKMTDVEEYDDKILALLRIGFTLKQIADILQLNIKYVSSRKNILIMRKQITQIKINKARKTREEEAENRRRIIDESLEEGKGLNTKIAQTQVEYCKAVAKLEQEEKEDIKLLSIAIQNNPELITLGNINFITTYFTRNNNMQDAIKFINGCMANSRDDKAKTDRLLKAKTAINLNMKRRDAIRMIKLGYMSIDAIVHETGLSMTEILELKGKMQSKTGKQNQIEAR